MTRSRAKHLRMLYWIVTPLFLIGQGWAACAGFTFDMCGAFASHLSAGDALPIALLPAAFFVLQLASYFPWKQLAQRSASRRRRHFYGLSSGEAEMQTP